MLPRRQLFPGRWAHRKRSQKQKQSTFSPLRAFYTSSFSLPLIGFHCSSTFQSLADIYFYLLPFSEWLPCPQHCGSSWGHSGDLGKLFWLSKFFIQGIDVASVLSTVGWQGSVNTKIAIQSHLHRECTCYVCISGWRERNMVTHLNLVSILVL